MTQKSERIFKDKAAAFNHLLINAPVGSLSKVLSKIKVFYNFDGDINKTFEGILNYHLAHLTITNYKEHSMILTSANLVTPKFLPVRSSCKIGQGLPTKGTSIADVFNPMKDKTYSIKKELANNLIDRFNIHNKSSTRYHAFIWILLDFRKL